MDVEPFLIFDLGIFDDNQVNELKLFTKETFAIREIRNVAQRKKKQREEHDAQRKEQEDKIAISKLLTQNLHSPSEGFVTSIAKEIDPSVHLSQRKKGYFSRLIKEALRQSLDERVTSDLHDRRCEEPDFSIHTGWNKADAELQELFMMLHSYIVSLGKDVKVVPVENYISFKRTRNMADVKLKSKNKELTVYAFLDPDSVQLQKGFTRDVRNIGHHSPNHLEITIRNLDDLERAKPLLQRSYEEAG